jgi:phage terminase small subunit
MKPISPKQEHFAQCIADGMTQADAYRTAYDTTKSKPESIWSKASELMADVKVTARVAELKAELAKKAIWTREMSVKALVQAYKVAQVQNSSTGMAGAIKELNAMHGYNAPKQVELSGGLQVQKIERVIVKK